MLDFVQSSLRVRLETSGQMVCSTVEEHAGNLELAHPRIAVASYPWEWTRSQWLVAAELTLSLCEQGLAEGWVLKDATPLNIVFEGTKPVLVDVLSFERYQPGDAIWLAYGQYVRTFLLPLVMNKLAGWPLALSLMRRDGFEPAELYGKLSWPQRLGRDALWPITLAALLERRKPGAEGAGARPRGAGSPEASLYALRSTLTSLRKRTQRAASVHAVSHWSDYTRSLTHYTAAESEAKRRWVTQTIERTKPSRVLDVGANTGEYSALVASLGVDVVALERDAEAAERLYRRSRAESLSVATICADVARPTPAAGWMNAEYSSLLDRLEEQFDVVMMLAVIHHLLLMEQIPLDAIVALGARLTRRWLIVEWVPATDPMFQSLLRGREQLYGSLCEGDLLAACKGRFALREREPLGNGRVLLLLEKENGC